jgi:hypothetical protein
MLPFYQRTSLSAFVLEKLEEYVKEERTRQRRPAKDSENAYPPRQIISEEAGGACIRAARPEHR